MSASPMQTSAKYATGVTNNIGEITVPGVGQGNAYVVIIDYYI